MPAGQERPDGLLGRSFQQLRGLVDRFVETRSGPAQIEKYASMPWSRTASAPGPIEPAKASIGQWSE